MAPPTFAVVRQNWHRHPGGWMRMLGERAVASFPTHAEAEAEAERRELAAREVVNPFACGFVWTDRMEMPEPVFFDWVGDHELPLPPEADGRRDWVAWWELVRQQHPDYLAILWAMLPGLRFFGVREVPPGLRVYVLLRNAVVGEDEWEPMVGGAMQSRWTGRMRVLPEGGEPVMLSFYRSRLEAERDRLDAERVAFAQESLLYLNEQRADPFAPEPAEYVPIDPHFLYEIAEVAVEGISEPTTSPLRVVFRIGHFVQNGEWAQCEEPLCLIPMVAFTDPAETDEYRYQANRALHSVMDPVLFAPGWSNGTVGATRLNELLESQGLPLLGAERRFRNKFLSTGINELGAWWRANGYRLTRDLRPAVWEAMGEYQLLCPVLEFLPDQLGFEWVI